MIRVYHDAGNVIETLEREGGCVNSSQIIKIPVRAILRELCLSDSVVQEWDDVIVDVHEKTTTIEVRILCTPQLDSLGNTVGSHRCLQHRWLSKKMTVRNERGRASTSFIVLR